MSIRISVVTPSYNQGKYLEETIRSVVSQRDEIHEYFVYDGGSTDESVDVIKKYEDKIDYWVSEKDEGQSDAIHKGFSRATGDVLFWLNSDDVIFPGAIRRVRESFENNPEWDVLTGYSAWIDDESRIDCLFRMPGESLRWAMWGRLTVCQQTCYFKREMYESIGGLNLGLHCVMDTEMWIRMMKGGAVWGHIPEYIGGFRHHDEAKGLFFYGDGSDSPWMEKYKNEGRELTDRFPEIRERNVKHMIGRNILRAYRVLSGSWILGKMELLRYRGKHIEEVFGKYEV